MKYVEYEDTKFMYVHGKEKKLLIDFWDFFSNKSAISLMPNDPYLSIPIFLMELQDKYESFFAENHVPYDTDDNFLIDVLVSAQLFKTSASVKLAEFGATNGRLSFHLASVLGKFNPASTLCSVCDSIGNESGNYWLDMISLVENSSQVSFVASDYHDTNLSAEHFDIVVLNGSVELTNSDAIVKEAIRLLKTNGTLICYAYQQPVLADSVRKNFSSVEEYPTSSNTTIIVAKGIDVIDECNPINAWKKEVENDILNAEITLLQTCDKDTLLQYVKTMNRHADIAATNRIIDIKLRCMELKEKLLIKYIELFN